MTRGGTTVDQSAVRVGNDIQPVHEVEESLRRFGTRYTERLFTAREITSCGGTNVLAAPSLAARFAAKEAVLKMLGIDDIAPDLRTIEIMRDDRGKCSIVLHGEAAELARRAGLRCWDVSLSHGGGLAIATVVAIAAPTTPDDVASSDTKIRSPRELEKQ